MRLEFRFLKEFSEKQLLATGVIDFVKHGSTVALMGPSGAGKTTFSRWVVGLESVQSGYLKFNDEVWVDTEKSESKSLYARRVALMSQRDSLFPHMSVAENIAYGLRNLANDEKQERVDRLLKMIALESHRNHKPRSLSGGERRRVALAQMLAIKPKLLILDEPLTGLDEETKAKLVVDLKKWIKESEVPTILITHDAREAQQLADRTYTYQNTQLTIDG